MKRPIHIAARQPQTAGWHKEQLFIDGDAYFSALFSAIERASESIYLESYIFEWDALGQRMVDALLDARERGVDVRVLVDGVGSASFVGKALRWAHERGLNCRVHHPLPWHIIPRFAFGRGLAPKTLIKIFSYANRRNHRKMIVIDGSHAFVGSLNISAVHCESLWGARAWHDLGVRIDGSACEDLRLSFLKLWNKSWRMSGRGGVLRPPLPFVVNSRVSIPEIDWIVRNDGRALRHRALSLRLKTIRQAERRVWIATAYFVPASQLLRALMAAARRGVDVRILLPRMSDVDFMPWISRSFYESLIKYGVKVYEFSPRILHAKAMISDDICWIGSSNLNHRSVLHDFELDVLLTSKAVVSKLEESFRSDFVNALQIDKLSISSQPKLKQIVVSVLLYFRHLL
jgi:cardiolipin synthase